MITNRDLTTEDLFAQAVEEAIESASENGVSESDLADILRAHAEDLAVETDAEGTTETDGASEPTEA